MKNLTKLFIVVMSLTMTNSALAQPKFGIKGGLNLATMFAKDDEDTYSTDYNMKPGFHLGVVVEFGLAEQFAIEPGLLFSTKGFQIKESGEKLSFNLNYVELPINAVYKVNLGGAKLLIHAGPYLGYAISGKMKSSEPIFGINGDSKEEEITLGTDEDEDMIKPLDYGLNFGAGVEMRNVSISAQYGLGLANLSPSTEDGFKMNNRVIGISICYKFGGNRRQML